MKNVTLDQDDEYERAMRRALAWEPFVGRKPGERYLTREEIHDRAAIRKLEEEGCKKNTRS